VGFKQPSRIRRNSTQGDPDGKFDVAQAIVSVACVIGCVAGPDDAKTVIK
jgi:hypothetical protein